MLVLLRQPQSVDPGDIHDPRHGLTEHVEYSARCPFNYRCANQVPRIQRSRTGWLEVRVSECICERYCLSVLYWIFTVLVPVVQYSNSTFIYCTVHSYIDREYTSTYYSIGFNMSTLLYSCSTNTVGRFHYVLYTMYSIWTMGNACTIPMSILSKTYFGYCLLRARVPGKCSSYCGPWRAGERARDCAL